MFVMVRLRRPLSRTVPLSIVPLEEVRERQVLLALTEIDNAWTYVGASASAGLTEKLLQSVALEALPTKLRDKPFHNRKW